LGQENNTPATRKANSERKVSQRGRKSTSDLLAAFPRFAVKPMNHTHYVSVITLLLCAGMTAPLWIDSQEEQQAAAVETSPAAQELTARHPDAALTPEPEDRLACGLGILSRLRNRGDRCVAVPQYAYPAYQQQPAYVYPQQCVPVQPQCAVPTQPIVTQPYQQPYVQPAQAAPRGGPCNCQSCCKDFQLTRWRVVPFTQEVTEDYIDCEVETSRFCDSNCDSGECVETIGIQNRKRHVVKQKTRTFTVTKLEQETVIEKRCMECGCIRDIEVQVTPTGNYRTQKPVLENKRELQTVAPPRLDNATFEPVYRQSRQLDWKSADQ
jgi:hypothetical protein